jgi:hypothetical protein
MDYQYSVEKGRLVIQAAGDIAVDEGKRFLQFTDSLPPLLFAPFENKVTMVFDSRGATSAPDLSSLALSGRST